MYTFHVDQGGPPPELLRLFLGREKSVTGGEQRPSLAYGITCQFWPGTEAALVIVNKTWHSRFCRSSVGSELLRRSCPSARVCIQLPGRGTDPGAC